MAKALVLNHIAYLLFQSNVQSLSSIWHEGKAKLITEGVSEAVEYTKDGDTIYCWDDPDFSPSELFNTFLCGFTLSVDTKLENLKDFQGEAPRAVLIATDESSEQVFKYGNYEDNKFKLRTKSELVFNP